MTQTQILQKQYPMNYKKNIKKNQIVKDNSLWLKKNLA